MQRSSTWHTLTVFLVTVAEAMQPAQTLGRHAAAAARGLPPCILTYTHICAVRACHSETKQTCRSAAEQSLQDTHQLHASPQSNQQQWQQSSRALQEEQQQQQLVASAEASADPLLPADDWLQRSRLLVGADGLAKLASLNVLLVGLGGVGSFAAEFLCRAGVGSMTLVDGDTVDTTNRNRQLPALASTVGKLKTKVVAERLSDINPDLKLTVHQEFLDPVRAAALVQEQQYQFVIDCIDSIAPKQALLLAGHAAGVPTISSMGAGGRLDPSRVRLADISETYNDAFAAVVRRRLRKAGVGAGVTVVFSDEPAQPASLALTEQQYKRSYFGTNSYIPALFGLYVASHVIRTVVEQGYQLRRPASSAGSSVSSKSSSRKGAGSTGSSRKSRSQARSDGSSSSTRSGSHASSSDMDGSSVNLGSFDSTSASASVHDPNSVQEGQHSRSADAQAKRDAGRGLAGISAGSSISAGSLLHTKPQQGAADTGEAPAVFFTSFERVQGVGMGLDGEGL